MERIQHLITTLFDNEDLSDDGLLEIIKGMNAEHANFLFEKALEKKTRYYKDTVYMRGLIEFTNYCKQNCNYCGIRGKNSKVDRYRLSKEAILNCCEEGYALGYRTFVMQGGEDPFFTDEILVDLIETIKTTYPDCAITLSVGERSRESYAALKAAGADRYLLRHETATKALYESLHPGMSFENRRACLYTLKELGYQVGAGFMVGDRKSVV